MNYNRPKRTASKSRIPVMLNSVRKINDHMLSRTEIPGKSILNPLLEKLRGELGIHIAEVDLYEKRLKNMDINSNRKTAQIIKLKLKLKELETVIIKIRSRIRDLTAEKSEPNATAEKTLTLKARMEALQQENEELKAKNWELKRANKLMYTKFKLLADSAGSELVNEPEKSQKK